MNSGFGIEHLEYLKSWVHIIKVEIVELRKKKLKRGEGFVETKD